jgi:hypothetical protein
MMDGYGWDHHLYRSMGSFTMWIVDRVELTPVHEL